ncbi:hypothetical protein AGABI1DRAFT_79044 [Agaricus bisporus var. burnettii JB137-S8]|uniref:Heme haloperoxidase family profile domain-containing protein n=1 Tax=Agaricus bisporus var. burnettii (strain JB137-S8 / ATCC MYA-4627 / FGSC 10392) TaxID=597362 RepID=K5WZ35_AGABU|nr:uncharacterized protein AGABI1DRAFT_79044 [Agaricus bisporus var. burnettii JB137-S8]EKM76068.1 hypothetical protein AGABI1DRAFT_79044 [Agaricus bisporus var. burnettii JB137-S8]
MPSSLLSNKISLPDAHPPVHEHSSGRCPVADKHDFCPPQSGDSRSPCPALNTMANHGYINRDGKNVSAYDIHRGLKACYGLSTPLALFLSYVGFAMLRRARPIDLYQIGKHNVIEHDASLVHHDTPGGEEYAPIKIDEALVEELIEDVSGGHEAAKSEEPTPQSSLMDAVDVARSRVRREKLSKPLDPVHAEIARGEMAIILGVWEQKSKDKVGVPVDWMKRWLGHERLPDGWRPDHTEGLLDVIRRAKEMRAVMERMQEEEALLSKAS